MTLAAWCQRVENAIVGAPCGIMDQVSSCYGNAGSLLRMICQPHELESPATLPPGIRAWGFPAWALWLGIHLWYLVGFQNRVLVFMRWGFQFVTHGRGNRLITGDQNLP